jgi:hypothetical protein
MRWKQLLAGVACLALTACATKQDIKDYAASKADITEYADSLYSWLEHIGTAVCQLEEHVSGLSTTKRQCPGGGETTPPPKFPPP